MKRKNILRVLALIGLGAGMAAQALPSFAQDPTRRIISGERLKFPVNEQLLISRKFCDRIFDMENYQVCFDDDSKLAKIVSYTLDGNKVGKVNIKERPRFYSEPRLPRSLRAHYNDYKGHITQRGHLAPDAAFDYDWHVLSKTYNLINIVPMYPKINEKTWSKVERYSRFVATKLGSVDVINIVEVPEHPERIGRTRLAVPSGFYKILTNKEAGFRRCFYYQNKASVPVKQDRLDDHEISCDKVYIPN